MSGSCDDCCQLPFQGPGAHSRYDVIFQLCERVAFHECVRTVHFQALSICVTQRTAAVWVCTACTLQLCFVMTLVHDSIQCYRQ